MSADPITHAPETPDRDAALLACFGRRRSTADLEQLVERHWASGYRLALRCLGDPAAAEDATQQALLDLVAAAPRFDGRRAFAPWFRTLVLNRVRKQARASERRRRHEVGAASLRLEQDEGGRVDRLDAELVAAQVAALPDDVRLPVVLHYYEGLSHADVAEALGCPKGTASSRIRRGLERLGEAIAGAGAACALPDLEARLRAAPPVVTPRAPATASLLPPAGARPRLAVAAAIGVATIVGLVSALLVLPVEREGSSSASGGPAVDTARSTPLQPHSTSGWGPPAAVASASTPAPPPRSAALAEGTRSSGGEGPSSDDAPAGASPPESRRASVELVLRDDLGRALAVPVVVEVMEVRRIADEVVTVAAPGLEAVQVPAGEPARLHAPPGVPIAFRVTDASKERTRYMMGHEPVAGLAPFWTIYPHGAAEDFVLHPGEDRLLGGVVPRASRLIVRTGPPRDEQVTIEVSFRSRVDASSSVSSSVARREVMRYLQPPGQVTLRLTCPGFDTFERELELSPGEVTELAPALVRSAVRAVGVVVDEEGRAVIGAKVVVEGTGASAASTADGAFFLAVGPGETSLIVSAEGHATTRVVGVAEREPPWVVRVTLRRAGALTFTVVDATGAPAPAAHCELRGVVSTTPDLAHLEATRGAGAGRWSMRDRVVELVEGPGGEQVERETLELGGETSADGALGLSRVPPGRYQVRLEDGAWRDVEVRAGEVTRVELVRE